MLSRFASKSKSCLDVHSECESLGGDIPVIINEAHYKWLVDTLLNLMFAPDALTMNVHKTNQMEKIPNQCAYIKVEDGIFWNDDEITPKINNISSSIDGLMCEESKPTDILIDQAFTYTMPTPYGTIETTSKQTFQKTSNSRHRDTLIDQAFTYTVPTPYGTIETTPTQTFQIVSNPHHPVDSNKATIFQSASKTKTKPVINFLATALASVCCFLVVAALALHCRRKRRKKFNNRLKIAKSSSKGETGGNARAFKQSAVTQINDLYESTTFSPIDSNSDHSASRATFRSGAVGFEFDQSSGYANLRNDGCMPRACRPRPISNSDDTESYYTNINGD
ncbi:uncharacterized protein LOC117106329 isoform X2 [Anneissia japonica]|nr:uncharacterized protein LOC117106329 isoform X2 [Anneissia japonica]